MTQETQTQEAPRARVRARTRTLDVQAAPAPAAATNSDAAVEEYKAKAVAALQLMKDSYAAKSAADKIIKELAAAHAQGAFPDFEFKFAEKTYDAKVVADETNEVDVALLAKEIEIADLIKIVKTSQGAVIDFGGKTLLNKVLTSVKKEPEFKLKARK